MSLPQRLVYMADDSLSSFPDLDPAKMSREAAYSIFDAILASQLKKERFIEFSIAGDTLCNLQPGDEGRMDEEIIELDDPPKSPSKSHKRSPRKARTKNPSEPHAFTDFSPPFGSVLSDAHQSRELRPATPPIANPPEVTPPASPAAPKKKSRKATTAPKKSTACKWKADDEGTVSTGPALKKHKALGPASNKGVVIAPATAPKKTNARKPKLNDKAKADAPTTAPQKTNARKLNLSKEADADTPATAPKKPNTHEPKSNDEAKVDAPLPKGAFSPRKPSAR